MKTITTKQDGAVLILVLIFLTVFLLGNAAILSATQNTGTVAANASFRSTALALSDTVLASAKNYLLARASNADTTLINTAEPNRYYPVITARSDGEAKTAFTWSSVSTTAAGSYSTQYVIERLCDSAAALPVSDVMAHCQVEQAASTGSAKVGAPVFSNTAQVIYRITIRVSGPKNTEIFTHALVSL